MAIILVKAEENEGIYLGSVKENGKKCDGEVFRRSNW